MLATPAKTIAKNLIKSILGQVPFTAELYWLIRHRDKKIDSRFSLDNLHKNLPEIMQDVENIQSENGKNGKKNSIAV